MFKFFVGQVGSAFSFFKKAILVFIVFFVVLELFGYFLHQNRIPLENGTALEKSRQEIYQNIQTMKQDKSQSSQISLIAYRTLLCGLIGEGCTENKADADMRYQSSLFGSISNIIAAPFSNPPASSIAWIQNGLEHSGFIPKTYAAEGIGFASIKGYISIWTLFRNLSFTLLVLYMLVLGFMIMFRVKLDAQTAVSIQSALPRIVVTMLLITFSFALAGLLIDLMYVLITVPISIVFQIDAFKPGLEKMVGTQSGGVDIRNIQDAIRSIQAGYVTASGKDLWPDSIGWPFSGTSFFAIGTALYDVLPNTIRISLQTVLTFTIAHYVSVAATKWPSDFAKSMNGFGIQGFTFGVSLGNIPDWIILPIQLLIYFFISAWLPGIVLGVIVLLTILVFMFKLFFMLLTSYLKIIMYIIFAPIILLFNIFPGNGSFSWWFKNLIGELLVFPTVVVISVVGRAVMEVNMVQSAAGAPVFRLPFLYGIEAQDINMLVSLGLILLTPDFIKMVKGWVGVGDSALNLGLGTFLSGAGVFTAAAGVNQNIMGMRHMFLGTDPTKGEKGLLGMVGLGDAADNLRGIFEAKAKSP